MSLETFLIFAHIGLASNLIPIFVGLFVFRRLTIELKLLLLLVGVSVLSDSLSLFVPFIRTNNITGNLYRIAECVILFMVYYYVYGNSRLKFPFIALAFLLVSLEIANWVLLQRRSINTYTNTALALIFIVAAIAYFYKLMAELPFQNVFQIPMFWVNVAILIYFAGNLFVFIVTEYLSNQMVEKVTLVWTVHNFLGILKNVLFGVGFYQARRPVAA